MSHRLKYPWAWSVIVTESEDSSNSRENRSINQLESYFQNTEILQACEKLIGSCELFPIQIKSLPLICESLKMLNLKFHSSTDICISAPTGSGKTLCYLLPLSDRLLSQNNSLSNAIQSIILVPSKLLVNQVAEVLLLILGENYRKNIAILNGSKPFELEHDLLKSDKQLINIVVSTPSRLFDHLIKNDDNKIDFMFVDCVVLDECDKLLTSKNSYSILKIFSILEKIKKSNDQFTVSDTVYHIKNIHPILKIMLSATITTNVDPYFQLKLFKPCLIVETNKSIINKHSNNMQTDFKYSVSSTLEEFYILAGTDIKPMVAMRLVLKILKNENTKILCFVNSVETAYRLCFLLNTHNKINACEISSQLIVKHKNTTVNLFQKGHFNVLVSTDTSSRGMDFKDVGCVINYDPPTHAKNYVHRVGRTARAYQYGKAITIVPPSGKHLYLGLMEKITRSGNIVEIIANSKQLEPFEMWFDEALSILKVALKKKRKKKQH